MRRLRIAGSYRFLWCLAAAVACGSPSRELPEVHPDLSDTNPGASDVVDNLSTHDDASLSDPSPPETGPFPGQFGAPCSSNADCESGFCTEGHDCLVCTVPCLSGCPTGWDCTPVFGSWAMAVCKPRNAMLCRPCLVDADCGTGRCL